MWVKGKVEHGLWFDSRLCPAARSSVSVPLRKDRISRPWMDREAVELELEGRKMLKQGVVEGENLGARKMPENDGERGGVEAGREDRSVVVEQKPVLRFPWMKKTKSHAHQWKAQWIGENKE